MSLGGGVGHGRVSRGTAPLAAPHFPPFGAGALASTGYPARMLLSLLLACAGSTPADKALADTGPADDTAADTDTTGDTDGDTLPDGLNGTAPRAAISLPTFVARNQYGEDRSEADVLGRPTVMWFYPAAGTYG